MIQATLVRLLDGEVLNRGEARELLAEMMDGEATPEQSAAILAALRLRGESTDELCGFAELMRERCTPVDVAQGPDLIDTCGTGGDGSGTFNVSTATAFVAAGMGLRVAKHGNRSVSSRCGSADVLEELGVNIGLDSAGMAQCIEQCGIGFLFAPALHPAMKQVAPVRRALGVRSFFNMLGPLTNPAGARQQLIGCWSRKAAWRMASVLAALGDSHAILVASRDGLDEISVCGETDVMVVADGGFNEMTISPEMLGLTRHLPIELRGGDRADNARIIRRLLSGEAGAARDIVLANAAACAVLGGLTKDLRQGVELAAQSIDSGAASARLDQLVELSRGLEVRA